MNRTQYVRLGGGIDLLSPPRLMPPGRCLYAVNYECPITGGYKRIDGYTQLGAQVPGTGEVLGVATFDDKHYAIRASGTAATLHRLDAGAWVAVGTVPTGRYEFAEGNFQATEAGKALFMVGGGKPYELKGGVLTEIALAPAGAQYIAVHHNHLFLGVTQGSVVHSSLGDPFNWDGAVSAGEIGTQQTLTGLAEGPGGVLHILCRNSVKTLFGSSQANFELRTTIPNSGPRPYSVQSMVEPYFINERGVSSLSATDAFGDFQQNNPGAQIEPLFTEDGWGERVQCSAISKLRGQYRVWFDNGSGVYMSPAGPTTVAFPHKPKVAHSGELLSGEEAVIFGDDLGFVYRLGNGANSFSGDPVTSRLVLAYTDLKRPSTRKRFRRVFWDISAGSDLAVAFRPDFDFGGIESAVSLSRIVDPIVGGGIWSVDNWDEFAWSSPMMLQEPVDLTGSGTAINFSIYTSSTSEPHELLGYDLTFIERRLRRG